MDVIPAIDLKDGRCVRLTQGQFASATVYGSDPLRQAQIFAQAGAAWLHVVDLDGARDGARRNFEPIMQIARASPLHLQAGGGIRDTQTIQALLDCGIRRVVIGSIAAADPPRVRDWLKRFTPERIVLAFDVRLREDGEPVVLVRGWQQESGKSLWDLLGAYSGSGLRTVLCTDVSRDGTLEGPNLELYRRLCKRTPGLAVQASGGVGSVDDLLQLANTGAQSTIVGKALYEGRIELAAALSEVKGAR